MGQVIEWMPLRRARPAADGRSRNHDRVVLGACLAHIEGVIGSLQAIADRLCRGIETLPSGAARERLLEQRAELFLTIYEARRLVIDAERTLGR